MVNSKIILTVIGEILQTETRLLEQLKLEKHFFQVALSGWKSYLHLEIKSHEFLD